MRKFLNIFEFYKSTLPVNLMISLLPLLYGGIDAFSAVFTTFGFVSSIVVKEINHKDTYLFYYNNGLSKLRLWICAALINLMVTVLCLAIYIFLIR